MTAPAAPLAPARLLDEYLEADGLGGFTSGTVGGTRSRRYHALLLTATTPPTGRAVLVAGFDAWIEGPAGSGCRFLSSQVYAPDVPVLDGQRRLVAFRPEPWPTWTFHLEDGTELTQELFVPRGRPAVALRWRTGGPPPPPGLRLALRPFLAARDAHALRRAGDGFRFDPVLIEGERVAWRPDPHLPAIRSLANARYTHEPLWYYRFQLDEERARGYDWIEDLGSPGLLRWDLTGGGAGGGEAVWILSAERDPGCQPTEPALAAYLRLAHAERARRARFPSPLHRAAEAFIVRRGGEEGRTIVAGYPWFSDWGRDTFVALRGLCLATGRLEDAGAILREWAGGLSEGMLPNRFPERGATPEFNSVDSALWFIVAVHDLLRAADRLGRRVEPRVLRCLRDAVEAILTGYTRGTRHGIAMDRDGLLAAGEPGVQLTWMDAKVDDWVVTPRAGKPVEVQALWLNALRVGGAYAARWSRAADRVAETFARRFWLEDRGYLADVVDPDGEVGGVDPSLRPNQLLAIGGLPWALLDGPRAERVVDLVERRLWTPLGPRSLAPGSPGYAAHYQGGRVARDSAYHQGTVWPWLAGPFVEAWVRVRGGSPAVKLEARRRFLEPFHRHLGETGLGHVSEIADAEPPFTPRGCPFQAWSLGELLRLELGCLAEPRPGGGSRGAVENRTWPV